MKEFLNYKYMITPGVLKILSYVAMVGCIIAGIFTLFVEPISGIGMIVLGPIVTRIYTELLLVMFEIHSELKKISNK
jgi:hypothetical protein|tara:strand:- start:86 stop:316 length:231 start_codon:yes stop_codon:yes gene_type:complete